MNWIIRHFTPISILSIIFSILWIGLTSFLLPLPVHQSASAPRAGFSATRFFASRSSGLIPPAWRPQGESSYSELLGELVFAVQSGNARFSIGVLPMERGRDRDCCCQHNKPGFAGRYPVFCLFLSIIFSYSS